MALQAWRGQRVGRYWAVCEHLQKPKGTNTPYEVAASAHVATAMDFS